MLNEGFTCRYLKHKERLSSNVGQVGSHPPAENGTKFCAQSEIDINHLLVEYGGILPLAWYILKSKLNELFTRYRLCRTSWKSFFQWTKLLPSQFQKTQTPVYFEVGIFHIVLHIKLKTICDETWKIMLLFSSHILLDNFSRHSKEISYDSGFLNLKCIASVRRYFYRIRNMTDSQPNLTQTYPGQNYMQKESPPVWTQEAYRPPRSKHTLCCSGRGVPTLGEGGGYLP